MAIAEQGYFMKGRSVLTSSRSVIFECDRQAKIVGIEIVDPKSTKWRYQSVRGRNGSSRRETGPISSGVYIIEAKIFRFVEVSRAEVASAETVEDKGHMYFGV